MDCARPTGRGDCCSRRLNIDHPLFPYLQGFKQKASGPNTLEYKIGEIFGVIKTRFPAATTSAKSSTISTRCAFARRPKSTSFRTCTKPKSKNMGSAGRNGGEYYTPRPLILGNPMRSTRCLAGSKSIFISRHLCWFRSPKAADSKLIASKSLLARSVSNEANKSSAIA